MANSVAKVFFVAICACVSMAYSEEHGPKKAANVWEEPFRAALMAQAEKRVAFHHPDFSFGANLRVNDYGTVDRNDTIRISQKLSDSEALVHVTTHTVRTAYDRVGTQYRARDVRESREYGPFFLVGLDLSGFQDDSVIDYTGGMLAKQTRSYVNVLGAKSTVIELVPIELPKLPKGPAVLEAEFRTWTDASGRYTRTARFAGIDRGSVSLVLENGSIVELPLIELSPDDKAFVRDAIKRDSDYEKEVSLKNRR